MNRRNLLRAIATAAGAGIAGCSSDSEGASSSTVTADTTRATGTTADPTATPTETDTATPTETNSTSTPPQYKIGFLSQLKEMEIEVRNVRADSEAGIVGLKYVSQKQKYQQLAAEIGAISGAFFRQVNRGWGMNRLNATILREDGSERATWYAKVKWFRQFQQGKITADELSLKIVRTVEQTG